MNYWIGVAGKPSSVARLDAESETWWCVPREAKSGDVLAMYCTASVGEGRQGIFAQYTILAFDPMKDSECKAYGSYAGFQMEGKNTRPCYATMRQTALYANPLSAAEMRRDPVLRGAGFVRRNFQGTFFVAKEAQFLRLTELLELKNRKRSAKPPARGRGKAGETNVG